MDLKKIAKYKDFIFIAILIILISAIVLPNLGIESVWPDEALYATNIEKLGSDPGYLLSGELMQVISYFPIIIATIINIFVGNPFLSGKIMVWMFSVLAVTTTYLVGKEFKNEFVGVLAGLFLAATSLFTFLSTRLLLDIPIAAMITLTIYTFMKFEKQKTNKWAVIFAITFFLTIFTKNSALPLIGIFAVYWIVTRNKKIFKDLLKNRRTQIIAAFGIVVIALLGLRQLFAEKTQALFGFNAIFSGGVFYYFQNMGSYIYPFLIPLFILGFVFLLLNIKKKNKNSFLIALILITYFAVLSIIVPEKVPRYMMPVVPLMLVTAAYAFSVFKIKNKYATYAVYGVGLIIFLFMLGSVNYVIDAKADSYTGFQEAGEWLSTFATPDSEIFIGSKRAIRAFSGFDYVDNGGNLQKIWKDEQEFFSYTNTTENKIFVELDTWEYTQPDWTYPLSQEVIDKYMANGFTLNHVVYRKINGQEAPVIVLMSKNVV